MSKILEEATELEQVNEVSAATIVSAEVHSSKDKPVSGTGNAPCTKQEADCAQLQAASPLLAYEEVAEPKPQTALHVKLVKKRSRKGILVALAALVVVAGLGITAYRLSFAKSAGPGIENNTEPPVGAEAPVFLPIDPADFAAAADENFIVVPDETGLALPAFGHGPQVAAEPQNHSIQTPHVSSFFTRAAQDESYVYFLQGPPATKYGLYKLMRANPSTGKAGSAINHDDSSVYSFALYGQNIITCEYKPSTDSFAFYRNPKSGEHAQLLFETASPAHMNVFDNKIFLLFVDEQALGVFDPVSDTEPSYIGLAQTEETAHYFPQFSVMNGYLYCGIWHDADADGQAQVEYFKRSMYTGEVTTLLSGESNDAIWNPCWDEEGNAYYALNDSGSMDFCLVAVKNGGAPQVISSFDYDGTWPSAAFKDEFLVTALPNQDLRQYDRTDFSVKLEVATESQPFAATKDFLIAEDGLYRLFDFGFVAFEAA